MRLGVLLSGSGDMQRASLVGTRWFLPAMVVPTFPLTCSGVWVGRGPPRAAWALRGLCHAVLTDGRVLVRQVHIEFTWRASDRITLEGPTEDASVAQEQIEAMVKDSRQVPATPSAG